MEAAEVSGRPAPARPTILGVPVDLIGRQQARERLRTHLDGTRAGLLHVLTLNPEYVMAARADDDFLAGIARADMIVCDGIGTAIAARMAGHANVERHTGVELIDDLAVLSAFGEGGGVFLLGGRDAAAAMLALRARFPAARVRDAWSGGQSGPEWDDESLRRIDASGANVLLVGYGAPAQVFWIERNRVALEATGIKVAAGIGGGLDYLSGHARLAPRLVRRFGMEWLWRLFNEPWRWKRQLQLAPFAVLAGLEAIRTHVTYRILGGDSSSARRRDSEH